MENTKSIPDELIEETVYKRIFEVTYSILKFVGLDPESNCTYFSLIGAAILHEHFGITCKAYCGAASYFLNEDDQIVLSFVEKVGKNSYISSRNAFHSWNENENWVVDFQAPLFPVMAKAKYDF